MIELLIKQINEQMKEQTKNKQMNTFWLENMI